jgi:flagella basal body P-ring formation protein FlgA
MAAAQGAELTRDMRPGQVLSKNDIRPSVMVKKGQLVTIHIGEPGKMNISAQLQALQDGRMGETINLKNPESGRLLSGVVTGLNVVRNP